MAFVDEDKEVPLWEIIQQREGRLPRRTPVKITAVIFNPRAIPDFAKHLNIVFGALLQALRFQKLAFVFKRTHFPLQVGFNHRQSGLQLLRTHRILAGREDAHVGKLVNFLARQGFHFIQFVNFIPEKFHTDCDFRVGRRENLHRIPTNTEGGTLKIHIVAGVLKLDKLAKQRATLPLIPGTNGQRKTEIFFRRPQAVNAGHRCHHDNVFTLH